MARCARDQTKILINILKSTVHTDSGRYSSPPARLEMAASQVYGGSPAFLVVYIGRS